MTGEGGSDVDNRRRSGRRLGRTENDDSDNQRRRRQSKIAKQPCKIFLL